MTHKTRSARRRNAARRDAKRVWGIIQTKLDRAHFLPTPKLSLDEQLFLKHRDAVRGVVREPDTRGGAGVVA